MADRGDYRDGTDVERRQLSSQWTFFYKFVFLTVWSVLLGSGTLVALSAPFRARAAGAEPIAFVFLGSWAVVLVWALWWLGPLKRVTLCRDQLIVSNFRREESIPLQGIRAIEGSRFISPERVTLRLRYTSAFGDTIVFMPMARATLTLTIHPVVAELRQLVGEPVPDARVARWRS